MDNEYGVGPEEELIELKAAHDKEITVVINTCKRMKKNQEYMDETNWRILLQSLKCLYKTQMRIKKVEGLCPKLPL